MSRVDTKRISSALGAGIEEQAASAAKRLVERVELEGLAEVAYASYESPLGTARVAATERGIVSVGLPNVSEERFLDQISGGLSPRVLELPARLDPARRQLDEYFAGERREFDLEIDWRLVRPGFYARVLRNTAKLPFGATSTYGEIATRAGSPRAYRAAGTALGRNPIPIVVPCHRVLPSTGKLGNYAGGPERKRSLLTLEGVTSR